MIKIDGNVSELKISEFANLEELLKTLAEQDSLQGRVITDVLVNGQPFSEIYPHQAEDMGCAEIESVEVRSEDMGKMAVNMAQEMHKVANMMRSGAENVARLLREDKQNEALELLQDLLDVTRDFMGLLNLLKEKYLGGPDDAMALKTEEFSGLISEMSEVLENEDWLLLADLLEFEFVPACDAWKSMSDSVHKQLMATVG